MINLLKKERSELSASSFIKILSLYLVAGFIVRIVLLCNPSTQVSFSMLQWIQIFLLGAINDACMGVIGLVFMWLLFIFLTEKKYQAPWGYILFGLLIIALIYVVFFKTVFDEYGSVVPEIVTGVLLYKTISFGLRLFFPNIRKPWGMTCYYITFFIYVTAILFNGLGEFFFWNEFGARYNFIAVDYLVYTNEVVGNIFESYPVIPLFSILFIISASITYFLTQKWKNRTLNHPIFISKLTLSIIYIALFAISCLLLNFNTRFQQNDNVYVNELQANGIYKFYEAFKNNELIYKDFYPTIPNEEAEEALNKEFNSRGVNNLQIIRDSMPELHKNIILITLESFSASYLQRYGNTDGLTPNLDQLMKKGLAFDCLFANGNRTVRGLEALTLCLPPSPGESIIKRPNNSDLFSTGRILKEKGYIVQFLYGGDAYFDNMKTFFSGNGYEVIDKKSFTENEITFSNIWGTCDEDIYNKAIRVFNEDEKTGKPFFGHIMSISNHRPYTYPTGKIDIPSDSKSRNGGVKYSDYALGEFFRKVREQPWFNNTVFIIVADHCASSAGKTEIPLEKYHIPALIYAPGFIQPQQIRQLTSQVDLMPTVFGLLHFSYDSRFYGKNVFSNNYIPRAFAATYQNMGYWEGNTFTVLSPVRRVEQYKVDTTGYNYPMQLSDKIDSLLLKKAIVHYQTLGLRNNKP